MTIKICPRCEERYTIGFGITDFEHKCDSGNLVLDEEDVVIVGDWEDFSGSGTIPPQEVLRQGGENQLQGTRADIEGEDKEAVTRRGVRASTRRQRQYFEFIEKTC